METSIINSRGQLLIPNWLRIKYGIECGTKMMFEETDKGVLITAMNEQYFNSFAGILTKGNLQKDIMQMKDEEKVFEQKKLKSIATKK